jgi:hypothetical protein
MNPQIEMIRKALLGEPGSEGVLSSLGMNSRRGMRERNLKVIKHVLQNSPDVKSFRESMKRTQGFDIFDDKAFPVREWNFSWKKLATKLEEADSSSSFSQFLRAGIQNITNAMYESVETSYEDWVTVVQSGKDTELYAPNHGVAFPRQVGPQTPYPEVGVAALDIQLKNRKHGSIYGVERELLEDDQTGSFQRQAGMLGEYLRLLCEVLAYGKLASVANMKYIDYEIPVSETKPSTEATYPWSTALVGGGATKPAAYGALSQTNIQEGIIALMSQKNLQGIKMQVTPNRLLIGPKLSFDAAVLIHSSYYPSGAAAAGNVGGAFAINPLKSILDITVSRFMFKQDGTVNGDSKAWYIVDDSKPFFIMQMREAATVVQENPLSGESFNRDIYRFKASSRQNADFIDPRFAWIGNDGSV